MEFIKIFLKKKKRNNENMVTSDIKISQKMKNKCQLMIEKQLSKEKTYLAIWLENLIFSWGLATISDKILWEF